MDPNSLEVGKVYVVDSTVNVCMYDADDCLMTNMIELAPGTELSYVGPDADDGYVFQNSEGTKFCLHDNDLYVVY